MAAISELLENACVRLIVNDLSRRVSLIGYCFLALSKVQTCTVESKSVQINPKYIFLESRKSGKTPICEESSQSFSIDYISNENKKESKSSKGSRIKSDNSPK